MKSLRRVGELLRSYRFEVTGSFEASDPENLLGFIAENRPDYQTEILDRVYKAGYQDALREVTQTGQKKFACLR